MPPVEMRSKDLKVIDGAAAGAWIRPRLEDEFASVTSLVPKGFAAYARIFHPASDQRGDPVSWSKVARALGKTAHREMQWHCLVGSSDTFGITNSSWTGGIPSLGEMDLEGLDALCEVLLAYSDNPDCCFFGLCTIQNWEESFTAEELKLPFLMLPLERDYIVLTGPLSAVDQIENDGAVNPGAARSVVESVPPGESPLSKADRSRVRQRDAPNLIWPADHSWFVASEVDFDSTLVGGDSKLISAIVESPQLEAWQVESNDSLAADADEINGSGEGSNR